MSIVLEQNLAQKQSLKFTHDLQQSVKILQLSSIEIQELITLEIEQNPFLSNIENSIDEDDNYENHQPDEEEYLIQDGNVINNDDYRIASDKSYLKSNDWAINYSENETLKSFVTKQLPIEFHEQKLLNIALYLTDLLDENGYILFLPEEICHKFSISNFELEKIMSKLHKLEPTGIFSRNLKECLTIQLKELNKFNSIFCSLLDNLALLQKGEMSNLAKICKISQEKLNQYIKEIKLLNPRPGSKFLYDKQSFIQPDIIATKVENLWQAELNYELLPSVKVNDNYYNFIKKKANNSQDKKFLNDKFYQANWLSKSLKHRSVTLIKVAKFIVKFQQEFFEKGVNHLKPMILANVADEIKINISSVCRIVNNKYILTPYGMLELKYFFSSALENSTNFENFSTNSVKSLLSKTIEQETKILSDEQLSKELNKYNISISRRTVTKYREELRIPPSNIRKSLKILANI